MYTLSRHLENATVGPGTNILISGPPLVGKRKLALQILAEGSTSGEAAILVSTRTSSDRLRSTYRSLLTDPKGAQIGFVDAVTKHMGKTVTETETVKYSASPGDLTGVGIKFSEFLQSFYTEQEIEHNRIFLDSLSTLLMYSNLQTVFQFVHVFTSRVSSANALGIYTIESTAHGEETLNTLRQLFDGVIHVDDETMTTTLGDVIVANEKLEQ